MVRKDPRAMVLGCLAAMVGFSIALATSTNAPQSNGNATVLGTGVGAGLKFSNSLLLRGQDAQFPNGGMTAADPNGFDLGDACYGSSIVRYLSGLNGVAPYTFTSSTIGTTGLSLGASGRVFGVIPAAAGTFAKFTARITDSAGASRTGTFRLGTFVCPVGTFRFAHDRLSDAKVGFDYITKIEVLNGLFTIPPPSSTIPFPSPLTFSIVPNSLTFNGAPISDMESLGLRLFNDGTIAGRPLKSGTIAFIARAQQTNGAFAKNRQNTAQDQPLTINIAALDTVETVLGTIASTIQGNAFKPGRDTFSYTAQINTNGLLTSNFSGTTVTVRLGGQTYATTLDGRGQSRSGNLRVALDAFHGSLRISLRNQDFSTLFGSLPDQSKKTVVIEVEIGDKFLGTEPLYFSVVNRHGHFRLIYGINRSRQVGGLFQFVSIKGDDTRSGTSFRTKFLISQVPDSSSESFGSPNDAVINIGPGFAEDLPLFNGRGFFPFPGIASININAKRRLGQIQTYPLSTALTGIQSASDSGGKPQTFLLGAKITTSTLTFNGAASLKIFPFFGH